MQGSFLFILNLIETEGELPVEVIPQYFFNKADRDQVDLIKHWLDFLEPFHVIGVPYEKALIAMPGSQQGSFLYTHEPLPQEDWRYWVISFKGDNSEIPSLASAAALLKSGLELGFGVLYNEASAGQSFVCHSPSLLSYFQDPARFAEAVVKVSTEEVKEIGRNYFLIKNIRSQYQHITRAIHRLNTLKSLPRDSDVMVIGLFSIIECLITHSPNQSESSDSLTYQIKTKMALLTKRFERTLDHNSYFEDSTQETIWSKLYRYRSKVVHGEQAEFGSDFQILKNRNSVISFLTEAVKLLILCALKEAELVTDLKKC